MSWFWFWVIPFPEGTESSGKWSIFGYFIQVSAALVAMVGAWSVLSARGKRWSLLKNFPGPRPLPLLGNALMLNKENHEILALGEYLVKKYGKVNVMWLFHKPYVIIADVDVAEKILSSKVNLEKGDDFKVFKPWWGSGLISAPATKWKGQRKLLNHTFAHSVLLDFFDIFNKESALLGERLGEFAENGGIFNIIPYMTATTLSIICETVMGKKLMTGEQVNEEYIGAVTGIYHILMARMMRPWLRPAIVWKLSPYGRKEQRYLKILRGFTNKVIAEKREQRRALKEDKGVVVDKENNVEGVKVHKAFMDYLLDLCDNGHELSDEDIRNEVDIFMAAGHDTTAYAVSWTLFLLATYPQHQVKVQQELDKIFGADKQRTVTSCDLSNLPYLSLCLKEALRLYSIVPMNIRKLSENVECGEKLTIPAGTNVLILPYIIQKDPEQFPSPNDFMPDRFLAENCLQRHPCAYIPFSYGPRNCIGQKFGVNEAKVILCHLLRSYSWSAVDKREEVVLDLDLVTRPMHGLKFSITKR